jgi:Cytidylate kinase-like family
MVQPQEQESLGDSPWEAAGAVESPRHGFQGDREKRAAKPLLPLSLSVAISRETGARGGSIGKRVGRKLGWQVYNQEVMEYIAQDGAVEHDAGADLTPAAAQWAEQRWQAVVRHCNLNAQPSVAGLAKIILTLGAQGEVILVGRGAGSLLPKESTLNVRIIAPKDDRVAYISQWLRLTPEEAAEQVELRDRRRNAFVATYFHGQTNDPHQFDLILNSSLLGEDLCADLIVQAARAKLTSRQQPDGDQPWRPEGVD